MQVFTLTPAILRSIKNVTFKDLLDTVGCLVAVITSNGHMIVLSAEAIVLGIPFDNCVITSAYVKVEPRLVALAVTTECNPVSKSKLKCVSNYARKIVYMVLFYMFVDTT